MNTSDRGAPSSRPSVVVIQPRFVTQAIAWIVLGVVAALVVERSKHVLGLVLVAIVISLVLRAPIEALSKNLPRWAAVVAVVVATIAVVTGVIALGTVQLRQEIDVTALVIGLRFNWLAGPLVTIFLTAAVTSTLAVLGQHDRALVLADQPAAAERDSAGGGEWGRVDPRSGARATAIAVAALTLIALVLDVAPALAWVIVGITLAIALDPLVGWIAGHTPLGRGTSISAVIVALFALVTVLLLFAVPSVIANARDLNDELPRIAADLEHLPLVGEQLAAHDVGDRIQVTVEELPGRLASDSGPVERALRSLGDGLVATFWVLLITVSAMTDGPRVRRGLRSLFASEHPDGFDRVDAVVTRVVARYAVGSVVIALIAGSATFTVAVVGGVPLATLIGLWVAVLVTPLIAVATAIRHERRTSLAAGD